MADVASPLDPIEQPKSELARLTGVFLEPEAAFGDIAAHPRWWVPMLILCILSTAFVYSFSTRVGWEAMMRQQMESNPRTQQMPAEQRERSIAQVAKFVGVMAYTSALVMAFVSVLVISAIFKGLFSLMEAGFPFKAGFAVTWYAMLPGAISSLLATIVVWVKDPADFNINNPLAFNIGAFLNKETTGKGIYSLATSIDLFAIWIVVLLGIGYSVASKRIGAAKSIATVASLWAVAVLVKAGFAALFG